MEKIVFITPFFGNTGSEIALFNLIIRIKDIRVIVVSKVKGSLVKHLPSHIQFFDYHSFRKKHKRSLLLFRLRNKFFKSHISAFEYFLDTVIDSRKTLFYVNTLIVPEAITYLQKHKYKFIVHAHELQHKLNNLRNSDVIDIVKGADFIFTSSKACKDVFATLGRYRDIAHSYPGVDVKSIKPKQDNLDLRIGLNIPNDSFVITMSGTIDINKRPETFLEIGRILKHRGLKIHLLWIGVQADSAYFYFLKKKTQEYDLEAQCTWVKKLEGADYYDYLNLSNCFVLTSTQESFSIVLVEALALGKPIFSFMSGGPQEIINSNAIGSLIEDYSTIKMADKIENLIKDEVSFNAEMAMARAKDFAADDIFETWHSTLRNRYFKKVT